MEGRRTYDVWVWVGSIILWLAAPGQAGDPLAEDPGRMPIDDSLCGDVIGCDVSLPSDYFSDGRIGPLWRLEGDDLENVWLDETHQRLELRSTGRSEASASYVSDDWGLVTTRDFALRVDFHHETKSDGESWLLLSLTPHGAERDVQYIDFGVGNERGYTYFWFEAADKGGKWSRKIGRDRADGTLYVSYDATLDELYVSEAGYGPHRAWATVRNVLQGPWSSSAVAVTLQGGAPLTPVRSGQAYFDSFVVEAGRQTSSPFTEVYRFWSPVTEAYFYTTSEAERDRLIRDFADVWTFQGVAFRVAQTPLVLGLAPVYRFWSDAAGSHFYTISEAERNELLGRPDSVWTYQGIAFYAYPQGRQPDGVKPVYRFWSKARLAYFYTISEVEKDNFLREYGNIYALEGIAFYAYE